MDLRSKLVLNGARVAFVVAVAAMAAAPFLFSATHIVLLTEFMSMLVLAIMWNLLAGYADIVTVGQHAFVGIGAYAFFGFTALWGLNPYLAIPLGGLVALVISVPTMILVFRLRTAYLAIGTWVVAELLMLAAGKLSAWGGGSGTSVPISIILSFGSTRGDRLATIYWLAFGLAAVAMLVTYFLLHSRIGIGLTAMRDNEEGAAAIGVNVTYARALCFLGTAPFLGMAGAIITLQKAAHSTARLVQHHRLDGLHHFQCRDRRHRQFRGSDHRHRFLLPAAPVSRGTRRLAPHSLGRFLNRHHPHREARAVGSRPPRAERRSHSHRT